MKRLLNTFGELRRYPSAIAGLVILLMLIFTAVYAIIAIPYSEALRLWRGGEGVWEEYPEKAPPAWLNLFTREKRPETIFLRSTDNRVLREQTVNPRDPDMSFITYTYSFDFNYDDFPKELALIAQPSYPPAVLTTLEVHLFSVASDFADELNIREISIELWEEFRDNGRELTEQAEVAVGEVEGTWEVVDGEERYAVRQEGEELKVYAEEAAPADPNVLTAITRIVWRTPDGREINLGRISHLRAKATTYFSLLIEKGSSQVRRRDYPNFIPEKVVFTELELEQGVPPEKVLFLDPDQAKPTPLKGTYTLIVAARTQAAGADLEVSFAAYGQVHGLAGTDHYRRDLMVAMLWGAPLALSFGLLAALGTSISQMTIAAIGTWFGGVADQSVQRITEVFMVLPFLPILIMVSTFYKLNIWALLGVVLILGLFGSGVKTQRAIFLQIKESSYIEAARSYGAGNFRIIFRYMIPRIIPMVIPGLVTGVPTYVFLEASLAFLGLADPSMPTWGKVINDANVQGALYKGQYYWILEPAILLMLTGFGFALVGYALDRIFNPRLRGM